MEGQEQNEQLRRAVQEELDKRISYLVQNDPQAQRLRGMLDVLENRVVTKDSAEAAD